MNNDWFDFQLPPDLIAQHPTQRRDDSRLMVIDRQTSSIRHHLFRELPALLHPKDLLVLNNTKVIPARIFGLREKTGGRWEGLFLRETFDGLWEMITQTGGKPLPGERISVANGQLILTLREKRDAHWIVEPDRLGQTAQLLERFGQIPLPPYIRKGVEEPADRERYQTVFAEQNGSIAAPTAGLHFTNELFDALQDKNIHRVTVTLHVGLGTFAPIKTEDPTKHAMHSEWGTVSEQTVKAIKACRHGGGRVIAVGTTATRALESASQNGSLQPWSGDTNIFIFPPYQFKAIDGLITNFHLPKTTLLLMVAALCGKDLLQKAYEEAICQRYRFFSYGDAMLIQ